MKRIEELEKMELDELESAAFAEDIRTPEGLEERIKECLAAKATIESAPARTSLRWAPYAAMAAAASIATVAVISKGGETDLKDTFDDPYLAYAQIEETFQKITQKMAIGVDLALEAGEVAEKPFQIINKINEK